MARKLEPKLNFEASLKELEKITHQMEREDLPLEEALDYFEKGVRLSAQCQHYLKQAEQKITIIENSLEKNQSLS